ncbi:MAG: HtaA domain-containing protein [Nocardioides sp.]|uniref:Ig-like domain repeat protein n=1 Tax=Nocardioides sp. TaxID=35761 RepID=UPI0039E60835
MPHLIRKRWKRGALASLVVSALCLPAAANAAWTGPDTLSEDPSDDPSALSRLSSDLAVASDGSAWFTWVASTEKGSYSSAATYWIYASHRDAGGAWEAPALLSTFDRAAGSQYPTARSVQIDVDGAGRPTVAWPVLSGSAGNNPPTSVALTTVALGADGSWSSAATVGTSALTSSTSPTSVPPALDVNPDGQAALAWPAGDGVHIVRRAADGTWGTETSVETSSSTQPLDTVGLGLDQEGRATLAWRSYDATASAWDVKARTQNSSGSWAGDAVTLAEDVPTARRTSIAVDTSGAAVATWGSNDGARAAVRLAGAAVGVWSTPHELSTGTTNAVGADSALTAGKGVPSAAFDPYGTASVTWPEITDTDSRVEVATVAPDGTWGDPVVVGTNTTDNPVVAPLIAFGEGGRATAVWTRAITVKVVAPSVIFTGGEVFVATRDDRTAAWSATTTYTQPDNSSAAGDTTVTGLAAGATYSLAGDVLGDASVGWTAYYAGVTTGTILPATISSTATRSTGVEWTARGVGGSSNVKSWLNYIKTDWASGGTACPKGLHGIEVGDGASLPSDTDDTSWRFTQTGAYENAAGKTVVQYQGTLRWVLEAHCIDIKITNPRLEIANDGLSARLYADGETSGSMSDAQAGNAEQVPFTNVRVLDIDLSHSGPRTDGDTNAWAFAPATLNAAFASKAGLDLYSGSAFGFLTVVAPSELKTAPAATLTAPPSSYGAQASATLSIPGATGTVTLAGAGSTQTAELAGGTASFTLPATLAVGSYPLTATYAGDATHLGTTATATLTVSPATVRVTTFKVAKKPTSKKRGLVRLSFTSATGVPVAGRVTVTLKKGKALKRVTGTVTRGAATVRLPKLKKGTWKLTGSLSPTSGTSAVTTKTLTLRIKR